MSDKKIAQLIVECLENEGVEYIFGLPGEENIDIIDALIDSKIRFILTRHEQGASFMADIYGRLTRKAGVCLATLGPGALNLMLGTADAHLDSSPLVAIAAQASTDRLNKESHQVLNLVNLFSPITKWSAETNVASNVPEVIRKAFKIAQTDRCGATAIIIPEDIAKLTTNAKPLVINQPKPVMPNPDQIKRAVEIINQAQSVVILAGNGICRQHAEQALTQFADQTKIPVTTTFMAKGVISDEHPLALGAIGFMKHDYVNCGLDQADCVLTIGYDLIEYSPNKWNPQGDKKIIHIHGIPAEVDTDYPLAVGIVGDINASLSELAKDITPKQQNQASSKIRNMIYQELEAAAKQDAFPLKPQRIVHDMRAAMGDADILLCDTGAIKMWIARLFPCYQANTCLISNSLATMAFTLPGALAVKLAYPERKVIAAMGDGSFLMNSQELETAKREGLAFVVLIWRDDHYGLIKWKQELELGREAHVTFNNPDFVKYAESFGIKGIRINAANELQPTLEKALASDEIVVIDCPVDYSENTKLTDKLGQLTESI